MGGQNLQIYPYHPLILSRIKMCQTTLKQHNQKLSQESIQSFKHRLAETLLVKETKPVDCLNPLSELTELTVANVE